MPVHMIDAKTLKSWLDTDQAVLIDVREPAEHSSFKISGATLLPLGRIRMALLPQIGQKKLVIHCHKGGRGASACEKLLAEDPDLEIYNLEGGITAWQAAGLAILSSGKKILPLDRQVQLYLGLLLVTGSLLAYFLSPLWVLLTGGIGLGLTFAGATGFCGLAMLLAKMPWNRG